MSVCVCVTLTLVTVCVQERDRESERAPEKERESTRERERDLMSGLQLIMQGCVFIMWIMNLAAYTLHANMAVSVCVCVPGNEYSII